MARAVKRRKIKTKFKLTKELVFLLLFLLVIGVSTILLSIESKDDKLLKKINANQTSEQTLLTEDNVFKEISHKKLLDRIDDSGYTYVYYGSLSNTEYMGMIETVNQAAKKYEVGRVYLYYSDWALSLDLDDEDNGKANKETLKDREATLDNVDLTVVPSLWVFKAGKVVFNSDDYINDDYTKANWTIVINKAFGNPENKTTLE